jgi:hypothetical protein
MQWYIGLLGANARERGACTGRASTSGQQKPNAYGRVTVDKIRRAYVQGS